MYKGSTIVITGGTGSWGQELTRRLLREQPKQIRIFSRNEFAQVNMQRAFRHDPALSFRIGDVRDASAVADVCQGADYVFHLAALKHVPICENQPDEALKTNVIGTENVIRACMQHRVKKVIDVSTDKAVDPINLYGMTKAIGEKLMIRANLLTQDTRFVCIRGGNVLGTNGSVVPYFKSLLQQHMEIPLTSKEMTRFFLTVSEAIDLLLHAADVAIGGETFVMKMPSCRIIDLATALHEELGGRELKMKETGIRPGEKLHEVLISEYESENTYNYNEQYYVILPSVPSDELVRHYQSLPKAQFHCYSSDMTLMSLPQIKEMLRKGGFVS